MKFTLIALALLTLGSSFAHAEDISPSCEARLYATQGRNKKIVLYRKSVSRLGKDLAVAFSAGPVVDEAPVPAAIAIADAHTRNVIAVHHTNIVYTKDWSFHAETKTRYGLVTVDCR